LAQSNSGLLKAKGKDKKLEKAAKVEDVSVSHVFLETPYGVHEESVRSP
jgi:hypothetical protein